VSHKLHELVVRLSVWSSGITSRILIRVRGGGVVRGGVQEMAGSEIACFSAIASPL